MVNNEYHDRSGYWFDYIELVRKEDGKQVYTSPKYTLDDNESLDIPKISSALNYYFNRVNSALQQQLDSPRFTEEQKKGIKLLNKSDYVVRLTRCEPVGYPHQAYWTDEAVDFLKN